jgi:hypothetical protein
VIGKDDDNAFSQKEISMKTTDYIRLELEISAKVTLGLIEDMKDAPLTFPTANGGNHPLWVLGHLAYVEAHLIQHVMLGRPNPLAHWKELFSTGTQPVADAARCPSFDEIMRAFKGVRANTLEALALLTDADLDQPSKACPPQNKERVGTFAGCFLFTSINLIHHRGQVADARLMAGRKPLIA